jgi:hypothetical protein
MNLKRFFLTVAAASGAVPGLAVISSGIGTPPESKVLFGGIMEALGTVTLIVLWINRAKIKELSVRKITRLSILLAVLFVVFLIAYVILLNLCVKNEGGATYFPLWTSGQLNEMIQHAGSRDAALDRYGIDAVHEAIHRMPSFALPITTAILLVMYQLVFTLLTTVFAFLGIHEHAALFGRASPH